MSACTYCGSRYGRSDCAQCWHVSYHVSDAPALFVDDDAFHLPDKYIKRRRRPYFNGVRGIEKTRRG